MSDSVDTGKRRFLTTLTSVAGGVAVVGTAYPFLASMAPSARAQAAGAPVEVDISKLQPGERLVVEWRKQPVWVVRRTEQNLADLNKIAGSLVDPNSNSSVQPAYAKNEDRSAKPEYLIVVGICTHLGCSPQYRPEVGAADLGGKEWVGGFFCPCHGSRFDLAGRVFKGSPAPTNLKIPDYKFINNGTAVVIGEDNKGAAV